MVSVGAIGDHKGRSVSMVTCFYTAGAPLAIYVWLWRFVQLQCGGCTSGQERTAGDCKGVCHDPLYLSRCGCTAGLGCILKIGWCGEGENLMHVDNLCNWLVSCRLKL